jgi:hypothetical protein
MICIAAIQNYAKNYCIANAGVDSVIFAMIQSVLAFDQFPRWDGSYASGL